jgi:hypothetical protein
MQLPLVKPLTIREGDALASTGDPEALSIR